MLSIDDGLEYGAEDYGSEEDENNTVKIKPAVAGHGSGGLEGIKEEDFDMTYNEMTHNE